MAAEEAQLHQAQHHQSVCALEAGRGRGKGVQCWG